MWRKKNIFPMRLQLFISFVMIAALHSCTPKPNTNTSTQRSYRMGFQNSAPNYFDFNKVLQTLYMWVTRADAAIISTQVPWDSLYAGVTPQQYVTDNYTGLVNYYRGKNMKLWVYIDPANGLNRSADASDLSALGKSIAQSGPQQIYGRFCKVMDSMLRPEHMGLALETNLIRSQSPDSIYKGIKTAANNAAADIAAFDPAVKLSVSVQVDWAWGNGNGGSYQGVAQDFTDFPFVQELGYSSYPYFFYNQPQDIPSDYYSRIIQGHSIPVFVSEGGWSSQQVGSFTETTQKQTDYITKQLQLLDYVNAIAVFQLAFTDIDINALPGGIPSNISQFAFIGLADSSLNAKPALSVWDQAFAKPLQAGH